MTNHAFFTDLSKKVQAAIEIEPFSQCWMYRGKLTKKGYARVQTPEGLQYLHRYVFNLANDAIPKGLQCDHTCRNRACCNPEHITLVTLQENRERSRPFLTQPKAFCIRGHPMRGANVGYRKTPRRGKKVERYCKACHRALGLINQRKRRERLKHVT